MIRQPADAEHPSCSPGFCSARHPRRNAIFTDGCSSGSDYDGGDYGGRDFSGGDF
jgi:hypothetical protein